MSDYEFLHRRDLTAKDKLVLLAADVWRTTEPKFLAGELSLPIASVRQSLAKADALADPPTLRDDVIAELVDVCELDAASMRSKDWKHLAKVAADLIEAGATPAEVRTRARNLRAKLNLPVTPGSLDKYWPQLAGSSAYAPGRVFR